MGIITLEDLKGRVEAVVFSEALSTYRSALVPDALVFLEGKVDRKREEPSLRVERVVLADDAPRDLGQALIVDIGSDAPIERMVGLFRAHPGECRVYLNVETGDRMVAQIECHASIRVACTNEFLRALFVLVNRNAVCLMGKRQRRIPLPQFATA